MKILLVSLLLLTLASCSAPQSPAGTTPRSTSTSTSTSTDIIELERQVSAQPNNPEVLFNLAMAYLYEDEINKTTQNHNIALSTLNKVLALAPGNVATLKAIYNIHYEHAMKGEENAHQSARKIFYALPLAQRNNLNPPSLAKFVHLYIINKQTQGAHSADIYQALLDASVEHPSNDKPYIQLAKMYRDQHYYPLALATLKLGAETIKDSPELYENIANTYEARAAVSGCSYEKAAYLNSAIDYYKQAIPLQPDNIDLHHNLAQLYMDNNLHQLALHETAIVVDLQPSAENLAFAAQNYSIIGNQQKANELLVRAKNAGLAASDSIHHEIYMNSGQWTKAALSFTDYLQVQPNINVYDFIKADIIGQQADIEFSQLAGNKKMQFGNEWEAAIFAFWTNKITRAQLEKNATNRCERTEYFFYSGYRDLQAGNKLVAKQQFTAAIQQQTYRFIERPLARYFLTLN